MLKNTWDCESCLRFEQKVGVKRLLDKPKNKGMLVDIGFGSPKYALSNTFDGK